MWGVGERNQRPPNPSSGVFYRDYQALAEGGEGGVEEVGLGGVGRVQQAGDQRGPGAPAPGRRVRL